jgi:hypothetical protein
MKRAFVVKLRALMPLMGALMVGVMIGTVITGVARAQYNLSEDCVVRPDLHYVLDGVDQTPYGGAIPDGHPAGFICTGRTYVPLRWLSELLGKEVTWDGDTATIRLSGAEWNENGVTMRVTEVVSGAEGTSVAVRMRNSGDRNQTASLDVPFYDGSGAILGTANGPQSITLAPGEETTRIAASQSNLSGYAYLRVNPHVTPADLYSKETRTGIPEVDQVLDAVMQKDAQALDRLVITEQVPCTTQPSGSDPRPVCPPGTPSGTVLDVFPTGHCQLSYAYGIESARQVVGQKTLARPLWAYAVYRRGAGDSSGYAVVLASSSDDRSAALVYLNGQGQIVEADTVCNDPSTDVPSLADFVLPPKDHN